MKHSINTKDMTPHDPARKFFPEFSTLCICMDGKKYSGAAVVDIDDRGGATLHLHSHDHAAVKPEPVVEPKKPVERMHEKLAKKFAR